MSSFMTKAYDKARRRYIHFAENKSIQKKKNLYRSVEWTKSQQDEFDDYWITYYGKKIPNMWHRLYESINGIHKVEYFPEMIFTSELEPEWNRNDYCKVLRDKSFLQTMYGRLEFVRVPKIYVLSSGDYYYNEKQEVISRIEAFSIVKESIKEAVIKPTKNHGSGKNVMVINIDKGIDTISNFPQGFLMKSLINSDFVSIIMLTYTGLDKTYDLAHYTKRAPAFGIIRSTKIHSYTERSARSYDNPKCKK